MTSDYPENIFSIIMIQITVQVEAAVNDLSTNRQTEWVDGNVPVLQENTVPIKETVTSCHQPIAKVEKKHWKLSEPLEA